MFTGCRLHLAAVVLLIVLTLGCGPKAQVADSFNDLYPTPSDQTGFRLRTLENLAARFEAEHGRMPTSIGEVVQNLPAAGQRDLHVDGWGERIIFERQPDTYSFRSAGPDRIPMTADDWVLPRRSGQIQE